MRSVTLHALDPGLAGAVTPGLAGPDLVEVHLGSWSTRIAVDRARPGELHLPLHLFLQWPLNQGQTVGLWESPDRHHLHLGPVVGITRDGPRRDWSDTMEQYGRTAEATGAIPVFFSLLDADLIHRGIPAALCRGADGNWESRACPLPDVIYDHGTYPDPEARRAARRQRRRLTNVHDVPFLNASMTIDQWAMYEALQFFSDTRDMCPETDQFVDRASFLEFLDRHRHVLIKSVGGTWSRNVLRIEARPPRDEAARPSRFVIDGYVRGKRVNRVRVRRRELWPWLQDRCSSGSWIVQQTIDRQQMKGRIFDFRIIVQKDSDGTWQTPHILINWAKPGETITNVKATSEFLTDTEFRPHWAGREREFDSLAARACHLALLAVAGLETRFGRLGELALDLASDRSGRVWLLRSSVKPPLLPGARQSLPGARQSLPGASQSLPFLYAQRLAEAAWTGNYTGLPALTETGGPPWYAAPESI